MTDHLWIGETSFDVIEVEYDAVLDMPWFKQANPLIRWKTNEMFLPDQIMPILINVGHLDQQLLFQITSLSSQEIEEILDKRPKEAKVI